MECPAALTHKAMARSIAGAGRELRLLIGVGLITLVSVITAIILFGLLATQIMNIRN